MKLTIPWKLHMVCAHLEPLLTRLGQGLAIFCEQAGETIHCKLKKQRQGTNAISTIASMAEPRKLLYRIGLHGMSIL